MPASRSRIHKARARFRYLVGNYVSYSQYCQKGLFVFVEGVIQKRRYGEELELNIQRVSLLSDVIDRIISSIHLNIDVRIVNQSIISELGDIISNNSGSAMLSIRLSDGTGAMMSSSPMIRVQ